MAGDSVERTESGEGDLAVTAGARSFPPVLPTAEEAEAGDVGVGALRPFRDASLLGPTRGRGRGLLGGAGLAVTVHLALVLMVVLYPNPRATWSGRGAGAGIEVELTSSRVFSDTVTSSTRTETAEAEAITARPVQTPEPAAEPTALVKREPDPTESDAPALAAARTVATAERRAPDQEKPAESERPKPAPVASPTAAPASPSEQAPAERARRSANAGGALRPGVDSDADVIAPSGELAAYNRAMVEAIDRCKPKDARGRKGTVYINYIVEPDGSVGTAYVVESSGQAILDDLALEALRSCRLAAPLPGLPSSMRFYNIFYRFQ